MISQPKSRLVRVVLTFVLVMVIAVAIFTPNLQRKTHAGPSHEVFHTYYSGPDYGTVVGEKWILCMGTHSWGQQTPYVVTWDGDECDPWDLP